MKKNAKASQKSVSTIIGADTIIGGSVTTENSIRIDGSIVGGLTSKGTVILAPTGKVTGNIVADYLVVAGTIEGDMWIKERAEFENTANVNGDITTTRLIIDEDAQFHGMSIMAREVEVPEMSGTKGMQDAAGTEASVGEEHTEDQDMEIKAVTDLEMAETADQEEKGNTEEPMD